jgi:PKD repeat protein
VRNIPLGKTVLVWKVELNGFSSQDTMSITNYTFSTDAGSDITTCSATIQMNAPQLDSRYQGDWRMILGTCAINSRASNHTTVKSLSPGKSTMQWTVTDKLHSECSAVDYVDIFFKTPPLAKFDVSEDKGCSPMKVLFANTSLDYVDLYWIFGDGTSSKELKPEHTFNLTQGVATEYTVKLVVQSANFCTDTARHVIGVSPEFQMDFVANPNEVRLPDAVVTSKVTLGTGLPYYRWRFGDSAADQDKEEIEHKYTQAGTYVISLVGRNKYSCEQSAYQTITVLPPYPNPDFSASMDAGCVPMAIQFINQSTYATSYIWSFGDGKDNATSENPTHIFNKSGAFDVTLTATSQYGTKSITKVFYADPVPSVDFTYTPSQISSPSEVVRFANASKGAQRYLWDFGDGLTSTDENPIHQYVLDAVYSISLTAITEHGCSQFTTRYNALVVSFLLPDEHTPLLEIKAYPNPSTTYLNIEINQAFSHKIELEILSLDGKKLQHTSLPEGTQQHTERLQNLAPGTYILKLDIGEQSKQIKFLKQ